MGVDEEQTSWILDDGALELLAKNCDPERLVQRCGIGRLLVAGATADAAKYERRKLLDLEATAGALVEIFHVLQNVGDPAAEILAEIHGESDTDKHLAEHEAISWALVHSDDSVLVTMDQGAMRTALAELGRQRVCYPFDLWLFLRQIDALSADHFQTVCEATQRHDRHGLRRMPERVRRGFPAEVEECLDT